MTTLARWLLRIVGAIAIAFGTLAVIGTMLARPHASGRHPVAVLLIVVLVFEIGPILLGMSLFAHAAHLGHRAQHRGPKPPLREHPWIKKIEAVGGRTALVLVAGWALLVGTGVTVFASHTALSMADSVRRACDWIPTPATIDEASVSEWREVRRLKHAHSTVRYHYAAAGAEFSASQLLFDGNVEGNEGDIWDRAWLEREVARLEAARRAGTKVTVFVNPARPSEAVVNPDMPWAEYGTLWFLIWGLAWAPAVAIGLLATVVHDRGVRRLIASVAMLVAAALFLIPPAGALLALFG